MPQEELAEELEKAGAFILPSVTEPWALVIHEAACAGLPILASAWLRCRELFCERRGKRIFV